MKKIAAFAIMFAAATAVNAQTACPVTGKEGSNCSAGEAKVVAASSESSCSEAKTCSATAQVVAASSKSSCSEAKTCSATAQVVAASSKSSCSEAKTCSATGQVIAASSDEKTGSCTASCEGEKSASVIAASNSDDCGDCNSGTCCAVEMGDKAKAIVAATPAFSMVVDGEETCCPETAQKMASEKGVAVGYKIADKTYTCHQSAGKAYAAALNGYLAKITTVQFKVGDKTTSCSVTASKMAEKAECSVGYQLASFEYHCPVQTKAATIAALKAIDSVRVTHKVGDTSFNCSKIATKVAELTGETVVHLVNGQASHCEVETSCNMAKAQIAAAAVALERVSQG